MKKYPNVLILMSDEHRFDVAGYAGDDVVRTPTLDWLAKDAVVFDNAYTPSPICIPARQCMAMGQYPSQCGVRIFGEDLPPFSHTFARQFTETGYVTTAAGKLHHTGMDQMQGWLHRVAGDFDIMDQHLGVEGDMPARVRTPRLKWLDSKEILRAGPGNSRYARRDKLAVQGLKDSINEQFVDGYYDRAVPEQPVMMYLGTLNPHYPYIAEEKLFNYYLNRVKMFKNTQVSDHYFLGNCPNDRKPLITGDNIGERDVRRAMAAYYANIETIDTQFGEILQELRDAGQDLDDWIIIYTSDHGEMLSEHSVWEKQKFYEGSAHVPLLIRYPKRFAPRTVHENVNLVDLFATLGELCHVDVPEGRATRSLVKLMDGDASGWDNVTYSEFIDNLMIKRDDLKYHTYPDGSEILFDLKADPDENINFMDDEKYADDIAFFRQKVTEFRATALQDDFTKNIESFRQKVKDSLASQKKN